MVYFRKVGWLWRSKILVDVSVLFIVHVEPGVNEFNSDWGCVEIGGWIVTAGQFCRFSERWID